MLEELLQSNSIFRAFSNDVSHNSVNHTYLLCNIDDGVRDMMFNMIAIRLKCIDNCGICPTCQKILTRTHADFRVLNQDGKFNVEAVNKMLQQVYLTTFEGGYKIYILDNADALQASVQNKLLKIIEEPPPNVVFFLATKNENSMLPTIISRAKKLYFESLSTIDIKDIMISRGIEEKLAIISASTSSNNLKRALNFAEKPGYAEIFEECFDAVDKIKKVSDLARFLNIKAFNKENIIDSLDIIEIIFKDILIIQTGANIPLSTMERDFTLASIEKGFTLASITEAIKLITEARKKLSVNVSTTAVIEQLFFDILEAKYKWQ